MALNEAECRQCLIELEKLKSLPWDLVEMPEAQDRISRLESALVSECYGSDRSSGLTALFIAGLAGLAGLAFLLSRVDPGSGESEGYLEGRGLALFG